MIRKMMALAMKMTKIRKLNTFETCLYENFVINSTLFVFSSSSDENILADSDDDEGGLQEDILMDNEQPVKRPKKKARRKEEKYIHEVADNIVDLADIKMMGNIACKLSIKFSILDSQLKMLIF